MVTIMLNSGYLTLKILRHCMRVKGLNLVGLEKKGKITYYRELLINSYVIFCILMGSSKSRKMTIPTQFCEDSLSQLQTVVTREPLC